MATSKKAVNEQIKVLAETSVAALAVQGTAAPMAVFLRDDEPVALILLGFKGDKDDDEAWYEHRRQTWVTLGRILAGMDALVTCIDGWYVTKSLDDPDPYAVPPSDDPTATDALSLAGYIRHDDRLETFHLAVPYWRDDQGSIVFRQEDVERHAPTGGATIDGLVNGVLDGPIPLLKGLRDLRRMGHQPHRMIDPETN